MTCKQVQDSICEKQTNKQTNNQTKKHMYQPKYQNEIESDQKMLSPITEHYRLAKMKLQWQDVVLSGKAFLPTATIVVYTYQNQGCAQRSQRSTNNVA